MCLRHSAGGAGADLASGGFVRQFPPLKLSKKSLFKNWFLKSGAETLKSASFFVYRTTFWRILSLL